MIREQRLGDLVEFINGDRSKNYPKGSDFVPDGIPFLSATELEEGRINVHGCKRITREAFNRLRNGKIARGDILFCLRGTLGKIGWISDFDEGAIASSLVIVRPKEGVSGKFIYYLLASPEGQQAAIALNNGSAQPNISVKAISEIRFNIPSLKSQEEIAAILSALDDKIELNRKTAATLEEMARALYRSWFLDFDPVHAKAAGDAPVYMDAATATLFPDSFGNDELPVGWEETTIGAVADIVGGSTPSTKEAVYWEEGQHYWATPRDLSKLRRPVLFNTERRITDTGLSKISSGLLPPGTLLLSSRAPIGYLAIADAPVAINQGFIAIRETDAISGIEAYFWCTENMPTIMNHANGSTFQEISKKNFRPITYHLAPTDVRTAFCGLVKPIFEKISLIFRESDTLADLLDTLLPKLMSGELRVVDVERQVEEAV